MMGCRRVLLTLAGVVGAESDLLRKWEYVWFEEDDEDGRTWRGWCWLVDVQGSIFGMRGCGIGVAGDGGQVSGC